MTKKNCHPFSIPNSLPLVKEESAPPNLLLAELARTLNPIRHRNYFEIASWGSFAIWASSGRQR